MLQPELRQATMGRWEQRASERLFSDVVVSALDVCLVAASALVYLVALAASAPAYCLLAVAAFARAVCLVAVAAEVVVD